MVKFSGAVTPLLVYKTVLETLISHGSSTTGSDHAYLNELCRGSAGVIKLDFPICVFGDFYPHGELSVGLLT